MHSTKQVPTPITCIQIFKEQFGLYQVSSAVRRVSASKPFWLLACSRLVVLIREAYYTFFWRLCNPFGAKILVIFDLYEAVILRLNASSYSADNNQAFW